MINAERKYKSDPTPENKAELLRVKLKEGGLTEEDVRIAAILDDPGANILFPSPYKGLLESIRYSLQVQYLSRKKSKEFLVEFAIWCAEDQIKKVKSAYQNSFFQIIDICKRYTKERSEADEIHLMDFCVGAEKYSIVSMLCQTVIDYHVADDIANSSYAVCSAAAYISGASESDLFLEFVEK